jgi:hypothetical protein
MLSARDSIQKLMARRVQRKQPDKLCLSGRDGHWKITGDTWKTLQREEKPQPYFARAGSSATLEMISSLSG